VVDTVERMTVEVAGRTWVPGMQVVVDLFERIVVGKAETLTAEVDTVRAAGGIAAVKVVDRLVVEMTAVGKYLLVQA
jgi:transposase InsO family protein